MRKPCIFIFVLGLAGFSYWVLRDDRQVKLSIPAESSRPIDIAAESSAELREQPTQGLKNAAAPKAAEHSIDLEAENKAGAVYFERDGKYAILSEDIILGEIKNSDDKNFGWVEPAKLQFWNLPIPYAISKDLPSPQRVEEAIRYFNEKTPVKFIPFKGETEALIFMPAEENCRSYLGKTGTVQPVFLSKGCGRNEVLHELMHALGFIHEQSRSDRDNFIEILWDNINPKQIRQFQKLPDSLMQTLGGSDFDFNSIMLYKIGTFAKNSSLPTMKSKTSGLIEPSRDGLSRVDIERLERIYGRNQH
ncbi:MAG: M12 family metallopeptidase [Deltaproteobacteria bacterium]|nr:M12 family metallopeptidase [Deltaproteobacteria bacterium]